VPSRVALFSLSSKSTVLSPLLSTLVQRATPSNSISLSSLTPMQTTFVVHPCICSCLNSGRSTLYVAFRGRGFFFLYCYRSCA
jgi:hypothetical protein